MKVFGVGKPEKRIPSAVGSPSGGEMIKFIEPTTVAVLPKKKKKQRAKMRNSTQITPTTEMTNEEIGKPVRTKERKTRKRDPPNRVFTNHDERFSGDSSPYSRRVAHINRSVGAMGSQQSPNGILKHSSSHHQPYRDSWL